MSEQCTEENEAPSTLERVGTVASLLLPFAGFPFGVEAQIWWMFGMTFFIAWGLIATVSSAVAIGAYRAIRSK